MTLLAALGPLGVGVVLAAIVGGLFAFRKTRADTHKSTAEAGKADAESGKLAAEAAKIIADAASGLITPLSLTVGKLESRVETLEVDNRRKTGLIRDFLTCGVPDCPVIARAPADIRNEVQA